MALSSWMLGVLLPATFSHCSVLMRVLRDCGGEGEGGGGRGSTALTECRV